MYRKKFAWLTENIIFVIVMVVVFAVLIGAMVRNYFVIWTYQQAEQLIAQEQYEEALEHLNRIRQEDYSRDLEKDYKDTFGLIRLCDSHIYFEQGEIEAAYECFFYSTWPERLEHQTEWQKQAIDAYREELKEAYRPIGEEKERQRQIEYEVKMEKIRSGVPYIGMLEYNIDETSLGAPASYVETDSMVIDGKWEEVKIYKFYRNKRLIFTAKCAQSFVIEVEDMRDSVLHEYTGSYDFLKEDDPYHASDYRSVERFYEANYDNFFSFEDAESYYRRHKNDG